MKGVPQGSPLSPLLFNIYVKDIPQTNNISQFADDIVLWEIDDSIIAAESRLQKRLNIDNMPYNRTTIFHFFRILWN